LIKTVDVAIILIEECIFENINPRLLCSHIQVHLNPPVLRG